MDVTKCNDSYVVLPPRGVKREVDGTCKYYTFYIFLIIVFVRWSEVKCFIIGVLQICLTSHTPLVRDQQQYRLWSDNECAFSAKIAPEVLTSWGRQLSSILLFNLYSFWHSLTVIELQMTTITPGRSHTASAMKNTYYLFQKWLIPLLEQFLI